MIVLRTLGTASIEIERSTVVTPNAPRRFAVLLYLAVERDREISREQLTSLCFSDQSSSEAAHSLREVMYQLRRSGAPIVGSPRGFMMSAEDVRADYDDALQAPAVDEDIMRAMAGGFLPAFAPPGAESYAEWLDGFRAGQTAALSRRMLAVLDEAMRAGRWESAERAARACIGLDPWNERATFALAEILAIGGSKAAALQLLDRYTAEVGPQSGDLAARAAVLRRRISEGLSTTLLGTASRNGVESFGTHTPRLIGREAELAGLIEAFDCARSGESQCVVIAGEPGIGKTRLASDFSAVAVLRAAHVERVTIQPHDGDRPMGAFVDLVPALLDANGALGCSPDSMAALRNLIGKRSADDVPQQAAGAEEHEQRWSAVSRAVVDLCEAIASEQTLVLVVEDAHWLDALSANTIGRIVGPKRKARILVIATTRDPRPLVRQIRLTERCQTITLPPLPPAAASELLESVLPTPEKVVREEPAGESVSSIKSRITAISAGNPLFLISLAAHSRAHRGRFEVPGTIVETFAQRIDALSRRGMSVLATCAELGKHSTIKRLVRALEMRRHEMVESLLELSESGLVLRDGQNAVPAHPLVAEALRSRLSEPAHRAVAHSVAETLESEAGRGETPALWWDVAASWRVADAPDKLIDALRQCARHALEFGRPGEAARVLNEAAHLPQSMESLSDVSAALIRAADAAAEYPMVREAFALRRRAEPDRQHDDLEIAELRALLGLHPSERFEERLRECLMATDATPSHRVNAAVTLLKCADMFGRSDLGAYAIEHASRDDLSKVDSVLRLEFALLRASSQGQRDAAAAIARDMLRECAQSPDSAHLHVHRNAATALILSGDTAEAIDALVALYDTGARRQSLKVQLYACIQLSTMHMDRGEELTADTWLGRAMAIAAESDDLANDFEFLVLRIETGIFRGDFEAAARLLNHSESAGAFVSSLSRRFHRAADLAIKVGMGDLGPSTRAAARTIVADAFRSMTGIRELEIAVATTALTRLGLPEESRVALREYFATRDEPRPASALLWRSAHEADCGQLAEKFARLVPTSGPAKSF